MLSLLPQTVLATAALNKGDEVWTSDINNSTIQPPRVPQLHIGSTSLPSSVLYNVEFFKSAAEDRRSCFSVLFSVPHNQFLLSPLLFSSHTPFSFEDPLQRHQRLMGELHAFHSELKQLMIGVSSLLSFYVLMLLSLRDDSFAVLLVLCLWGLSFSLVIFLLECF